MIPPSSMNTSAEMQLLLSCARVELREHQQTAAAILQRPIDWSILIDAADRHGVAGLLHRHVSGELAGLVPKPAAARLRKRYVDGALRALLLDDELGRLLRLFAARAVPVLAYKGPALEQQVYGSAGLRTFSDLDLLVRRADFAVARGVLREAGYHAVVTLTATQERAAFRTECDEQLVDARGALVELHWAITPPYFSLPLATEDLFERAVRINVAGTTALAPCPEDAVLLLAINGAKDCWVRLEPLCMLNELLARDSFDWHSIRARAHAVGAERMLALAVRLAHELLGTSVPVALADAVSSRALDSLARDAVERLLSRLANPPDALAATVFRLRARERWRDRVRHVVWRSLLPTREDCAALPVPPSLWPAAALARPLRLLDRARRHVTGAP